MATQDSKQSFRTLIPIGTEIEFIKHRWRYITFSIVSIVLAIGVMVYNQMATGSILNFGIDFAGGSLVQLRLDADKDPGIVEVRNALDSFGYEGGSAVVVPDREHEVLVRVKDVLTIDESAIQACRAAVEEVDAADEGERAKQVRFSHPEDGSKLFLAYDREPNYVALQEAVNQAGCEGTADQGFGAREGEFGVSFSLVGVGSKLQAQLDEKFGAGVVAEIVRSETVGAKVGGQLKEDGAKALLYAIGFIFLFVMIRFDLRFAPGGIVALTHDAILVIGAFAITGKEFNLQTIAAVLTIIGYSINDTIVVFDRVRERVALFRDAEIEETTNHALNETLSRTILTSGTTLVVVLATYILGSGPIKDFAFALIIGIIVGTYSSLYIATPVFLWVNRRFYGGEGHLKWAVKRDGTGTLLGAARDAPSDDEKADKQTSPAEGDLAEPADDDVKKVTRRRRRRPRSS